MMATLECVQDSEMIEDAETVNFRKWSQIKDNTTETKLIQTICKQNETWCLGSTGDTTVGRYGAFNACNSTERVSWMLNQFYNTYNDTEACGRMGGMLNKPEKSQSKQCRFLLRQAGPVGTGAVTSTDLSNEVLEDKGQSDTRKLSTPEKAGIGLGISLLFLFAIAILFYRRRRKRNHFGKRSGEHEKTELPDNSAPLPEIEGEERQEIGGAQVFEISHGEVVEMPTIHNEPVELAASDAK
jgi:hypothetical protein